jgi:hypothetical protein
MKCEKCGEEQDPQFGDCACNSRVPSKDGLVCPFCAEDDFDRPGLKQHLERYCEEYKKVRLPRNPRREQFSIR